MTERSELSLGELFSQLTQETRLLLRKEVELAKAELSEKMTQMQEGAVSMAVGGVAAFAGLLVLLFALVYGLAVFMDLWLAALIVGVLVCAIGIGLIAKGRSLLRRSRQDPLPRTKETLREDKQWIKAQLR